MVRKVGNHSEEVPWVGGCVCMGNIQKYTSLYVKGRRSKRKR